MPAERRAEPGMKIDPYRAPAAAADAQPEAPRLPVLLLGAGALLLLLLAAWCFYLGSALAELSAGAAARIQHIEEVSQRIETRAAAQERGGLAEFFERNRELLLDDIRYQRSAQVNFIVVGGVLLALALLQLGILVAIRRKAPGG